MGNTPKKKLKLDSDIKLKLEWEATAQQGGPPPEDADKYKPLNNESNTESNNKSQNSENNQSYDSESNGQDTEPTQKSESTSEQKKEISDKEQAENDQINKDLANGKQNPNELNNELNKDENNPNQQNQTDNQQNNNQNSQNNQNNQNNNQNNSNNNQNNNQPNNQQTNQQTNTENKNSDNKSSENKTEDKSKNDNKQRTQDKRERNKEQIEKSAKNKGKKNGSPKPTSPDKFKNAKGFKGKANYLANKARNKAKGTEMFQRIKKAFQTVQKVIQVLQTLWKPIAIVSLIVVLLFNGTIFIISISKSIGTTPHYYCDINPDDPITKTFLYQQYCSTKGSRTNIKEGQLIYPIKVENPTSTEPFELKDGPIPVTSSFGGRESPGGVGSTNHHGTDLGVDEGTPLVAAFDGVVCDIEGGPSTARGYTIVIYNEEFKLKVVYQHLQEQPSLSVGDEVVGGQEIALSGNTGHSTGPHLHFEVHGNQENNAIIPWMAAPNIHPDTLDAENFEYIYPSN